MKKFQDIIVIISLLLPTKLLSQKPGVETLVAVNTPYILFANASKNVKYPLGGSLIGRFFLTEKVALNASLRYDNFIYKVTDRRIGYLQTKVGATYFVNLFFGALREISRRREIKSYLDIDFGLAKKATSGSFDLLAYSVGIGTRWSPKNKLFYNVITSWVGINDKHSQNVGWLDTRIGLGYLFGK